MDNPALSRNVAVLGNIHHGAFPLPVSLEGKTLLLDMLIESTRTEPWNLSKDVRYTDTTVAEEEPEDTTIRTYENAVTLYEDKQYYPDAEDVGVESVE